MAKYEPREHVIDAELADGNREAWRQMFGFPSAAPARRRIVTEEGCATCAELARGSFGPSHDPSLRCESGKRSHCTCDICF